MEPLRRRSEDGSVRAGLGMQAHSILPALAAGIAALVASVVLCGWIFQIDILKRFAPGLTSMNPLTAISFELICASMWLQRKGVPRGSQRSVVVFLSVLVLLVGASKLLDVMAGTSFCPDDRFFASQLSGGQARPSRIAPNAAACLMLFGLGLLLSLRRRGRGLWHPQLLMLPVLALALLAIVGYFYDDFDFYAVGHYTPMALHTAFNCVLLAIGFVALRPGEGWARIVGSADAGGASARMLLPVTVLMPVVLGWFQLRGVRLGWFPADTGAALMAVAIMLVGGFIVLLNSLLLHRAEERRALADREVAQGVAREREDARVAEALGRLDELIREAGARPETVPDRALSFLREQLHAPMGALLQCVGEFGNARLRVLATQAQDPSRRPGDELPARAGLPGACLQQGRTLVVDPVPADYFHVRSGMLDAPPAALVLVPIRFDGEISGMIELASLRSFSDGQIAFVEKAARVLSAVFVRLAAQRLRLARSAQG